MFKRQGKWSGRKKTETRSHAARTFAKKRRNWVIGFNTQCSLSCVDVTDPCPNGGKIPLVLNSGLRASLGDSVRVARILGDLWFQPEEPVIAQCADIFNTPGLLNPTLMRVGLLRQSALNVLGGVTPSVNPMLGAGLLSDAVTDDYGEAKWLHQWTHSFDHVGHINTQILGGGCCGDVHTTGAPQNIFVDGSGTFEVETDCNTCEATSCVLGISYDSLRSWHLHIDWKKPIIMKNDDDLGLYIGWEKLAPCGGQRPAQQVMGIWGGIRLLVEL